MLNKKGYVVNWKELEKQNLDQTINTLSMLSPFSLEEKQVLLETINLFDRKKNTMRDFYFLWRKSILSWNRDTLPLNFYGSTINPIFIFYLI